MDRAAARRYAEAFVNTLTSSHRLEAGVEELKVIAKAYAESKDLQRFLGSPEISPEDKQQLLDRLWSEDVSPETRELLKLLIRWDRIEETPL
ncbi:MAG: F0F1 ATP synthase subunit delta, partial [Candidatus Omnitrophica bacterium]|nr:F0F1 ATP synthase subunit delta [Candidatus Omnitrophota bacterium]